MSRVGDKFAFVSRTGQLQVRTYKAPSGNSPPRPREMLLLFSAQVRFYVSSIYFDANMLVSDGFDNKLLVFDLDENDRYAGR